MDVGTNSTRLLVADVDGGRVLAEHAREMVITRLGKGVDRTRRFDPEALKRTLSVIEDYAATCERLGVDAVRLAATSATRDATNAGEFVDGVRRILGVGPEVLSGAEEAAASFLGATYDLDGQPRRWTMVFDIGGGSTEFMDGLPGGRDAGDGGVAAAVPEVRSLDIGSVRLTERHIANDPPTPDEIAAVRADAEAVMADVVPLFAPRIEAGELHVVGVAGTVTTVAAIAFGLDRYDRDRVHRSTLTAEQVAATAGRLCAMTVAERAALPVMPKGREDVIAAGALILDAICRLLGLDAFQVSETDILDGILLGLAERRGA
jgi:exopolyphosphatase/guanosine-5'-triphosphate,3'-diphosphate pyrophosphatase